MEEPDEKHYIVRQRDLIHSAITEAVKLDPRLAESNMIAKGWVVVVDLVGRSNPDDESLRKPFRGTPVADVGVFSGDAIGDGDLPSHTAEALLRYCAAHYEEIYEAQIPEDDENDDEDD